MTDPITAGGSCRGQRRCAACGREGCRLYRYAGEFLRAERIVCRACIRPGCSGWVVPVFEDADGSVFGHAAASSDSIRAWEGLPP
jgi:hypothetical protein